MSVTIMKENFNPIRRTIKNNNIFLVTDAKGNVVSDNSSGYGLYTDDTRFLSRLELKINDSDIITLSESAESGHSSIIIGTNVLMINPLDLTQQIEQQTIEIKRESIIYGSYFETITIANYSEINTGIKLELFFDADFLDIFEVRKGSTDDKKYTQEPPKGKQNPPAYENKNFKYVYHDTTGATLTTEIVFTEEIPIKVEEIPLNDDGRFPVQAVYEFQLDPNTRKEIKYQINLKSTAYFSLPEKLTAYDFNEAFVKAVADDKAWFNSTSHFISNNQDFSEMIDRGYRDINMLRVRAPYGNYIAAGIPWFTTLFGRDSLIAARQSLLLNTSLAKIVLETLANFQGKEDNEWRDEEPGKIPHEIRFGEWARSNFVPHSTYYGSVDATPLWLMLLSDYFKWTNDSETLERLWPNALNCLKWMDNNIKANNGFVAYKRRSPKGLTNQGWKDSGNSSVFSDGTIAEPPISLVEVQGYYYAAKTGLATLAAYLGEKQLEFQLLKEAEEFKKRFQKSFWMEDMQFYALGLDKDGKQMNVITSNPGHCLETGIIDDYYVNIIAERFFEEDMFSGWGIRTLSSKTLVFNPMSYHNGSVWPHDNCLIAYGLSRIGRIDLTHRVITGLFGAARLMQYKRLPELFCGFSRKIERLDPPVQYPVACIPQAWSAASIFMLIQSMLNISPDAQNSELRIFNPTMPDWLESLNISNIRIGQSAVDIKFIRTSKGLPVIDVLDKRGKLDIIIKR